MQKLLTARDVQTLVQCSRRVSYELLNRCPARIKIGNMLRVPALDFMEWLREEGKPE